LSQLGGNPRLDFQRVPADRVGTSDAAGLGEATLLHQIVDCGASKAGAGLHGRQAPNTADRLYRYGHRRFLSGRHVVRRTRTFHGRMTLALTGDNALYDGSVSKCSENLQKICVSTVFELSAKFLVGPLNRLFS